MSEQGELRCPSTPWVRIPPGQGLNCYTEGFDAQPMTPPARLECKEPPKHRRKSKYRELLGEQQEIPENTEINPILSVKTALQGTCIFLFTLFFVAYKDEQH